MYQDNGEFEFNEDMLFVSKKDRLRAIFINKPPKDRTNRDVKLILELVKDVKFLK